MSIVAAPRMITDRLEPGEHLTWWSQPRQGIFLRRMDALMIPFSLLWAGFMVVWEYGPGMRLGGSESGVFRSSSSALTWCSDVSFTMPGAGNGRLTAEAKRTV